VYDIPILEAKHVPVNERYASVQFNRYYMLRCLGVCFVIYSLKVINVCISTLHRQTRLYYLRSVLSEIVNDRYHYMSLGTHFRGVLLSSKLRFQKSANLPFQ